MNLRLKNQSPPGGMSPAQLFRVLEVLRQAEVLVENLAEQVEKGRGVVKLPPEGYPLEWIERDAVTQALQLSGWVQKDAAAMLAISPRVMNYKIHTLGIRVPADVRRRQWKETGG